MDIYGLAESRNGYLCDFSQRLPPPSKNWRLFFAVPFVLDFPFQPPRLRLFACFWRWMQFRGIDFFLVYAFPNQQVFNRGSLLVCLLVIVIFFLKPVLNLVYGGYSPHIWRAVEFRCGDE